MSSVSEIQTHFFDKEVKFNDALVIISHPTIGAIASITGNYIIDHLSLKLVGGIYSDDMHPTTMIHNGKPKPPIQIWAGEYKDIPDTEFDQIVVISSNLPLDKQVYGPLADTIIEWCQSINCTAILTIEGINRQQMNIGGKANVYHVLSTDDLKKYEPSLGTEEFSSGMVTGLSGVLLYRCGIVGFPIISLIADAHKDFQDARSAAAVLEALNKLVPKIEMDHEPLLKEAEQLEERIREHLSQIQPKQESGKRSSQGMFA